MTIWKICIVLSVNIEPEVTASIRFIVMFKATNPDFVNCALLSPYLFTVIKHTRIKSLRF